MRVGLVANPFSARDIRRVIANAASLQITDRANIVLRVLACLGACGVSEVLAMPERGGIRAHVERGIERARNTGDERFAPVRHLDFPVTGTVEDTRRAVRAMVAEGVSAIVVLGGDGTHRAVAMDCGRIPIACVSTGTNNAFPDHREPTVTGLATGLAVTGQVPPEVAYAANKRLLVSINETEHHPALVDVALVAERVVGARALWRPESLRELYVTFADPSVIGLSAIAGFLDPVGRREPEGVMVDIAPLPADASRPDTSPAVRIDVPIAPGWLRTIGVRSWSRLAPGASRVPRLRAGMIALDGEREVGFGEDDDVRIVLEPDAVRTVDVEACMDYAARNGLFRRDERRALGAGRPAGE
ncbi:MAG: NAD(+)/NADH kinase [Immundisolibacterales bacterium]|nr:NAD(+)/NADH kinase [Immundisolibacterales bacterium]